MPISYPSVKGVTLGGGSSIAEEYIPLWVHSNTYVGYNGTTSASQFIQKGSFSVGASANTASKLHTLNSSWSSATKYSFEVSIYVTNSSYTAYASLYDITSSAIVASSQISTTSSTATVLRSGSFALTPGHSYAVTIWTSNAASNACLTKAHLVAIN